LPTPGPVTTYNEALNRVNNYLKETNIVSKRNPLMNQGGVKPLPGLDGEGKQSGGKVIWKRNAQGVPTPAPAN